MSDWYYTRDGKQKIGPLTTAQLRELARSGQLLPSDMVKREGMPKWEQAAHVKGLFDETDQAPTVALPVAEPAEASRRPTAGRAPKAAVPLGRSRSGKDLWGKFNTLPKGLRYGILGGSAGALLLFCFLCCGLAAFMGQRAGQERRRDIEEAHRLWTAGDKAEAVAKYKKHIDDGVSLIEEKERPTVFQRVIEFDVEQGDTSSARRYVEKAFDRNVALAVNPAANEIVLQVKAEREEKRLAEEKRVAQERANADDEKLSDSNNKHSGDAGNKGTEEEPESKSRFGWDAGNDQNSEKNPKSKTKKLTQEELDGMTLEQVFERLGRPTESYHGRKSPNVKLAVWEMSDGKYVAISYIEAVDGKSPTLVVVKAVNRPRNVIDNMRRTTEQQ